MVRKGRWSALPTCRESPPQLVEVDPVSPIAMAGVSALLLLVGLAAAFGAAQRLRSIDPIIALRAE